MAKKSNIAFFKILASGIQNQFFQEAIKKGGMTKVRRLTIRNKNGKNENLAVLTPLFNPQIGRLINSRDKDFYRIYSRHYMISFIHSLLLFMAQRETYQTLNPGGQINTYFT